MTSSAGRRRPSCDHGNFPHRLYRQHQYRRYPGQAQQVALARIVLMDPATLILDEATSLLDAGAARSAERALDAVLTGRTVVVIAHRLDAAAAADRVAVVIDEQIVNIVNTALASPKNKESNAQATSFPDNRQE